MPYLCWPLFNMYMRSISCVAICYYTISTYMYNIAVYIYVAYGNRYAMSESQKHVVVAVISNKHYLTEQRYTLHSACDAI
eukprot:14412-Heterococcus_DN1.PRE.1